MVFSFGLDISTTKTGWALTRGELKSHHPPELLEYGVIPRPVMPPCGEGYPFSLQYLCRAMAESIWTTYNHVFQGYRHMKLPWYVVIEHTSIGKNRFSQRALEWTHLEVLKAMAHYEYLVYVDSGAWRHALGLTMTKEQKKNNRLLAAAKKAADPRAAKKAAGVKGKVTKKHVALNWVNDTFGLKLKVKDNDIADAICESSSLFYDVEACDGT